MKEKHSIFINKTEATGQYTCAVCGLPLFDASKKFDAGCGFPSFWLHIQDRVRFNPLNTYGRERTQLLCQRCGQHLGHLFPNPYTPTGLRYCINETSIQPAVSSFTNKQESDTFMSAANLPVEEIMQTIREHRSSESNYPHLQQTLDQTITAARQAGDNELTADLQAIREKYATEYEKSKEAGGTAWPEFEKFVTQFERALSNAKNGN